MSMSPSSGKKRKHNEETMRASSYDGSALSNLGPPINAVTSGTFRDTIRRFLKDSAEPTTQSSADGFPTWRSSLVSETKSSLYIVEEDVSKSERPLCDSCRYVGWSHHFLSKRRYHLIIPREGEWTKAKISTDALDINNHLLHGMIHCNGFGHLLCIDQTEEIMNLWDRICSNLRVRKITVQDLEKKGTMELRLLYALTYGRSWFAKWGYNFHRGSFGVTQNKYERALQVLRSLELDTIVQDNLPDSSRDKEIQQIITVFREAAAAKSETSSLVTVNDLFQFMLAIRNNNKQPPQQKKRSQKRSSDHPKLVALSSLMNSRWPARRLEHAVKVIANTLKNHKKESVSSSMSRQELRDAVRLYIGDTGLIDFVIKNISDVAVGKLIIRRRMKPQTKTLEFSVEETQQQRPDNSNYTDEDEDEEEANSSPLNTTLRELDEASLDDVVKYVYDSVVRFGHLDSHPVKLATKVILNTKHFIKDWELQFHQEDSKCVNLMCKLIPSYDDLLKKLTRPLPPPEVLLVPLFPDVTLEKLKLVVQKALRDTYFLLDTFVVEEVRVVDHEVLVRGSGLDFSTNLCYEGGLDEIVVDCIGCGSRDDDGERMVRCDECLVWHHTLCCSTIDDDQDVPHVFICERCSNTKVRSNTK